MTPAAAQAPGSADLGVDLVGAGQVHPRALRRLTRLGLALVEAITAAHHGQLRICSGAAHHHITAAANAAHVACRHPGSGTTTSLVLCGPRADVVPDRT